MALVGELRRFLAAALLEPVGPAASESDGALRRRRIAAGLTLLIGAGLLTWALRIAPGDDRFYLATVLLALVWVVGALASGPLHRGRSSTRAGRRDGAAIVQSLALATLLVAVFLGGAFAVARIPELRGSVERLLDHARYGSVPVVLAITMVNGVAEELYFRGALFAALPTRRAVAVTTVIYALTTIGAGIPLLTFAAVCLGAVTGLQRRVTGGVLGPIITHITWSSAMLLLLPYALATGG